MNKLRAAPQAQPAAGAAVVHRKPLKQRIAENWQLYLLLLIPVIITIVYKYGPMYGIQIAFRDFKASRGITGSEWVGLEWFEEFFSSPNCGRMIKNTVLLSLYSLLWSFPVPIILALALNQLRFRKLKRVVQTVLYAPHFISTMIICGMLRIFLSPSGGLITLLFGTSIDFLNQSTLFRTIYGQRHLAGSRLGHHHLPCHPFQRGHRPLRSRQGGRRVGISAHSAHRPARPGPHGGAAIDPERFQPDEHRL